MAIFFISDGEFIRVSSAENPEKRIKELQAANPKKLQLLHTLPGTLQDKQALHKSMSEYRTTGEWFKPNPVINDIIKGNDIAKFSPFDFQVKPFTPEPNISKVKNKPKKDNIVIEQDNKLSIDSWRKQLMTDIGSINLLEQLPMTPSEIEAVLSLPIYGTPPVQTVAAVNAVKNQLRGQGFFYLAAQFADSILQDSVIFSNLQVRIKSLIGSDMEFVAADDSTMAETIKKDIEENFERMAPATQQEEMMRWGLMLGVSVSQIMWSMGEKWIPTLKIEHPKNLWFNWATREYNFTSQNAGVVTILPENIQWDLFMPYTDYLPWSRAMLLALAELWLIRNWGESWWARHQERVGSPILGAVTSAEATPNEERLFIQQLYNLASNAVVRLPQGVEGNKFDLKLIESNGVGYEGFKQMLDYCDRHIAMVIQGQDKTAMAKSSGMSIGGNDAGESVALDLRRSDARALSANLRENLFKPYILFNYGEEYINLAPTVCWDIEEEEDLAKGSSTLNTLFDGLTKALNLPMSNEIDFRAILEQYEVPLLAKGTNEMMAGVQEHIDNLDANKEVDLQNKKESNMDKIKKASSFTELKKLLNE